MLYHHTCMPFNMVHPSATSMQLSRCLFHVNFLLIAIYFFCAPLSASLTLGDARVHQCEWNPRYSQGLSQRWNSEVVLMWPSTSVTVSYDKFSGDYIFWLVVISLTCKTLGHVRFVAVTQDLKSRSLHWSLALLHQW